MFGYVTTINELKVNGHVIMNSNIESTDNESLTKLSTTNMHNCQLSIPQRADLRSGCLLTLSQHLPSNLESNLPGQVSSQDPSPPVCCVQRCRSSLQSKISTPIDTKVCRNSHIPTRTLRPSPFPNC